MKMSIPTFLQTFFAPFLIVEKTRLLFMMSAQVEVKVEPKAGETKQEEARQPYVNKWDVFKVLTQDNVDKMWLVVSPKNMNAKFQNHILTVLVPSDQNPAATETAKLAMNDLQALVRPGVSYPKLKFELPPMMLRSKMYKMAGPGLSFSKPKPGEPDNMLNWTHSYWLVASVEGLPQKVLDRYGGAAALHQKQLDALKLLKDFSIYMERKRYFHPELSKLTPDEQEQVLSVYQAVKPDITLGEARELSFKSDINDHKKLKIFGNLKATPGQSGDPGISLKSKAWFKPKTTMTKDDIDKQLAQYYADCKKWKFSPLSEMVQGLQQGYRFRRPMVYGYRGRKYDLMLGPANPSQFHARGGDFVTAMVSFNIYDAASKGSTYGLEYLKIEYQATNDQNLSIEAGPEMEDAEEFQDRYAPKEEDECQPKQPPNKRARVGSMEKQEEDVPEEEQGFNPGFSDPYGPDVDPE